MATSSPVTPHPRAASSVKRLRGWSPSSGREPGRGRLPSRMAGIAHDVSSKTVVWLGNHVDVAASFAKLG